MRCAPADRVSRTQSGSGLRDRFPKAICRLDQIRGRSRSISSLSCVEWRWRLRAARREGTCIRSWTRQCAHGPHPGDDRAVDRPARLREYCEARQGGRFHVCQAKCADHFKHPIPFARTHNRCWRCRRGRGPLPRRSPVCRADFEDRKGSRISLADLAAPRPWPPARGELLAHLPAQADF
jgi:hypothetical protein